MTSARGEVVTGQIPTPRVSHFACMHEACHAYEPINMARCIGNACGYVNESKLRISLSHVTYE